MLNFTKMEFSMTPQTAEGSTGAPVRIAYDLALAKIV